MWNDVPASYFVGIHRVCFVGELLKSWGRHDFDIQSDFCYQFVAAKH